MPGDTRKAPADNHDGVRSRRSPRASLDLSIFMRRSPHIAFVCPLVIAAAIGCRSQETQMPSPLPDDFEQLLQLSMEELQIKTEAHKAWGLGTFDRWDLDQEVGNLMFSSDEGTTATATAQIIGSFSTRDNSWLWAWDNPSIVDELKVHSLKLKEYGEQHGIERLTTRKWTGTEDDAWAMTALAVKLCGAQGAYRGPSGPAYVFMTFGEVTITKTENGDPLR
jgi:hypothetical protein